MQGDKQGKLRGIIPRSVEQIIEKVMRMRDDGWEVIVNTSMLEIYNEELRDILCTSTAPNEKDKGKLKISNLQGFVTIAGLTVVELDTQDLNSGMMMFIYVNYNMGLQKRILICDSVYLK